MNKRFLGGFTIIEVSLFLALSGMLMVGLIATSNRSIARQRYNDTVNDVADYFRGVYSDVMNVSSDLPLGQATGGAGRSDQAVYGKLLLFGPDNARAGSYSNIVAYDIVGKAITSDALNTAINNAASTDTRSLILCPPAPANPSCQIGASIFREDAAGTPYKRTVHTIPWESSLENTSDNTPFSGAVLILRSPISGTIRTYVSATDPFGAAAITSSNFYNVMSGGAMTESALDICIDSPDNSYNTRRNLRINAHASNSSSVELVAQDNQESDGNHCGFNADFAGNPPGNS
ncbi:hypothetical protein IJH89_01405 [Candidatus Saccharibacteria bacterium]|nr:hypothetical protein [Candidatus Saccharibacteria bacterium]